MDLFYLDGFDIDPTNPDALVSPFRSSVNQVYDEMAPIGHYNLEEVTTPLPEKENTQRRMHSRTKKIKR